MSSSSSSTINGNVVSYDWVISDIYEYSSKYTSNLSFPSNNGIQFQFRINPKLLIVNRTYATIFVALVSCNKDKIKLKHRMSVVNADGKYCHTQETVAMFKEINSREAPCHILRDDFHDLTNGWRINGSVTIHSEVELIEDEGFESGLSKVKPGNVSTISQHFESLLESAKHSDVVLAIGEKEFRAHKLVLSTRSPVFAAMFDHSDTKEAQQGRVEIVDVAVEVFELFLRYLYTDKIDDQLDRFAPELLAVADMYQMDCLKSLCEHFLCSTLTIDNVSQLLIHADLYRAEALKCKCIDYITDNSEKVKTTEGWKAVAIKADLLVLLFDKISIKHNSGSK